MHCRTYYTNVCHVPSTHSLISGTPKSCAYNNTCTRVSKYSNRNATGYKYKILINNPPESHDYNSSLRIRKAAYYCCVPYPLMYTIIYPRACTPLAGPYIIISAHMHRDYYYNYCEL